MLTFAIKESALILLKIYLIVNGINPKLFYSPFIV